MVTITSILDHFGLFLHPESRDASDQHFEDDYIKVEYVPFFPRVTSLKSEESQSKSIDLNALAAYVKRSEHGAPTSEYEAMLYIVEVCAHLLSHLCTLVIPYGLCIHLFFNH